MLESDKINNESLHMIKTGKNFLGILNDLKRRPEDAARELDVHLEQINAIIEGKKSLSSDIIKLATKIWPVNHLTSM